MNDVSPFATPAATPESRLLEVLTEGPVTAVAWLTDLDLRVTAARGNALRVAGLDFASVTGRTLVDIMACADSPNALVTAHFRAVTGEPVRIDVDWLGRAYAVQVAPTRSSSGAIDGCVGVAFDVTEQRRAAREVEWLQRHDLVTGLAVRSHFRDTLSRAIGEAQRTGEIVTIVHVALDHFFAVNSIWGESVGDAALRAAAERLIESAGAHSFVARTGGDEFAVLVSDAGAWKGKEILDRLAHAFAVPVLAGGHEIRLTASIGSAAFPADASTPGDLMRAAGFAQRRSKDLGGNQLHRSDPGVTVPARERLGLTAELEGAIDRGELSLHYQPLIRLSDGALVSMEALLRWTHGGEVVPAAHFIRIAEESHLIVPIGNWVIHEACRQWAEWNDRGIAPARIAVNLGARHFHHPSLLGMVREALDRHRMPGSCLEIEITETTAMDERYATEEVFDQLRDMGVEITIDDFGTGHSSLSYLKRFAITGLKIDRSFVNDLPASSATAALVDAIVTAARALGLKIVAEGVETPEQAAWLRAAGCDDAQGYLFARPVDAEAAAAYLRHCQHPGIAP